MPFLGRTVTFCVLGLGGQLGASNQATRWGFPAQIKFIVGNEAAERFSFYGMRSILVVFMIQHLLMKESDAKGVFHTFVSVAYFLPLLGGYLADRYWGKYKTIMILSSVYVLGHLVMSLQENYFGLYAGLALIALGSGGIKPCVSAHVGDQFSHKNKHLIEKVFEIFYWSINLGSFFSTLMIPKILVLYGPGWAFGIPGVLMAIAVWIFWLGRHQYVSVPASGKEGSARFVGVLWHAVTHQKDRKPGQAYLDVATEKFGVERVEGAKAALSIGKIFIWVTVFWSLFDQHSSTWVLQATRMNRNVLGTTLEASQMAALNPILVMILIPLFSLGIYPLFEKFGVKVSPLKKMSVGMLLAGFSFVVAGFIETVMGSGVQVNVLWQFFQFLIITASEVMISIIGLEFAYTQAPRAMKSTIMSMWMVTIALGNFLTAVISYLNPFQGALEFFFYAVLMFVVAGFFIFTALHYKERNYVEGDQAAEPDQTPAPELGVAGLGLNPQPS